MHKSKRIKQEEKLNNMKGITLIALVITIIVLLILAGVTLASVTGDYGLFGKAGEAAGAFDRESVRERVQLEVMGSYNEKGKLDRKELQENIEKHLKVKHEDIENTEDGEMKFPMGDHNVTIDKDGFVWVDEEPDTSPSTKPEEPGLTAADIAADPGTYYGEEVTGYTDLEDVDWQIFYSDGTNIYLTTTGYVPGSYLPSNGGGSPLRGQTNFARAYYFQTYENGAPNPVTTGLLGQYSGSGSITDSVLKNFNKSYYVDNSFSSTNSNMQAVSYMMDQSIWANSSKTDLWNGDKADYLIGGVPLEMFFESYNQKKFDGAKTYQARAKNNTGYEISRDSGGAWASASSNGMIDTSDSLYCINSQTNAVAAWLASPSSSSATDLMMVFNNGGMGGYNYGINALGFRPLVRLRSGVRLDYSFEIID